MNVSKERRDEWRHFWDVITYPWSIAFFVPALLLSVTLVLVDPSDKVIVALLTLLVSLSSGILGGILAKRWDDLSGEQVLVARGKSAIRSLMLLFKNVQILKRRVVVYLQRHTDEEYAGSLSSEVIQTYFEEVILTCQLIEEKVLSSVDNWQDIIPEADVESQSRIIHELAVEQVGLTREILRLGKELEEVEDAKEQTEEEKERLRTQLRKRQRELSEMERKLLREDPLSVGTAALSSGSGVGIGSIGGGYRILDSGGAVYQVSSGNIISPPGGCMMCGKTLEESASGLNVVGYCSECLQSPIVVFSPSEETDD